jgi:hypothetical protein
MNEAIVPGLPDPKPTKIIPPVSPARSSNHSKLFHRILLPRLKSTSSRYSMIQ